MIVLAFLLTLILKNTFLLLLCTACPPDSNGLSASDYSQAGNYFFHRTSSSTYEWTNAESTCTALELNWVDVNSADNANALKASDIGIFESF